MSELIRKKKRRCFRLVKWFFPPKHFHEPFLMQYFKMHQTSVHIQKMKMFLTLPPSHAQAVLGGMWQWHHFDKTWKNDPFWHRVLVHPDFHHPGVVQSLKQRKYKTLQVANKSLHWLVCRSWMCSANLHIRVWYFFFYIFWLWVRKTQVFACYYYKWGEALKQTTQVNRCLYLATH